MHEHGLMDYLVHLIIIITHYKYCCQQEICMEN